MRGIVLAAGKGSRLNGTAADRPKCLVELGGLTLIERQIRTLDSLHAQAASTLLSPTRSHAAAHG